MEPNEFYQNRGINNLPRREKKHTFRNNVVLPFVSSIVGCTLVIGTFFGVPVIRNVLTGKTYISTSANVNHTTDSTPSGTIDFISLESYSDTTVYAANKILPSIVGIEVTYNVTTNSMFSIFGGGGQSTSTAKASGSGIIISQDGYILTNNHVVDSASQSTYYSLSDAISIKVKLSANDAEYDAKIIGKDSQTDLAVLKIEANDLTAAEFADSDSVKMGEFAMAVGNPLDLGMTITCGIVSALNREVSDSDGVKYKCIQTDAAINSGNSGGALVNSQGQVIGVNTLKVSSTGVEGIGFAIPINSTLNIIDELITYNKVRRPYIGITGRDVNEADAKKYSLIEGIYIYSIDKYSAAEKAQLKVGDIIVSVDGKDVKTMEELNSIKNEHSIGDTLTLKIYRDTQYIDVQIKLGESN